MELLSAGLVELSDGEYACATVMPAKKDILGNWTEKRMCGDYRPVNKKTKLDRYPMPTPEELFDAVGKARVFSTLDLRSGYHQLPLRVEDRVKTAFWGVDDDGKDSLFHWKFLPFGLKNAPAEFQRVMDQVLKGYHSLGATLTTSLSLVTRHRSMLGICNRSLKDFEHGDYAYTMGSVNSSMTRWPI